MLELYLAAAPTEVEIIANHLPTDHCKDTRLWLADWTKRWGAGTKAPTPS